MYTLYSYNLQTKVIKKHEKITFINAAYDGNRRRL